MVLTPAIACEDRDASALSFFTGIEFGNPTNLSQRVKDTKNPSASPRYCRAPPPGFTLLELK